jgi:C-terminal processing protease CtpA/Prc
LEVLSVQPDSPAFRGNVRPKDAIVEIDGASVAENKLGVFDLLSLLEGTRAFKVTVERDGQLTEANIVPEAPPAAL